MLSFFILPKGDGFRDHMIAYCCQNLKMIREKILTVKPYTLYTYSEVPRLYHIIGHKIITSLYALNSIKIPKRRTKENKREIFSYYFFSRLHSGLSKVVIFFFACLMFLKKLKVESLKMVEPQIQQRKKEEWGGRD